MQPGRTIVLSVAGLIFLVTAVTATPLWDVPDYNTGQAPLGQGTATVSVVSAPERATIEPGRQGGGVYYLRVPDAEVEVTQLRGNPLVTYSIKIDEMGKARSTAHALGSAGNGRTELSIEPMTVDADELDRQRYEGRLRLVVRGDEETVVYSEPITIEVEE